MTLTEAAEHLLKLNAEVEAIGWRMFVESWNPDQNTGKFLAVNNARVLEFHSETALRTWITAQKEEDK